MEVPSYRRGLAPFGWVRLRPGWVLPGTPNPFRTRLRQRSTRVPISPCTLGLTPPRLLVRSFTPRTTDSPGRYGRVRLGTFRNSPSDGRTPSPPTWVLIKSGPVRVVLFSVPLNDPESLSLESSTPLQTSGPTLYPSDKRLGV